MKKTKQQKTYEKVYNIDANVAGMCTVHDSL